MTARDRQARDRQVVPSALEPRDRYAGDEACYEPGDHANALACGFPLDPDQFLVEDRAFHQVALDVLAGRRPWGDPELNRLATALALSTVRTHDRRPVGVAEVEVDDEVLLDIVEDFAPDFATVVERVVGPRDPAPLGAFAALAFLGIGAGGARPVDLWATEEEDRALVRSARVVAATAPGLFVDGRVVLPVSARASSPELPPGCFVARMYRRGDGWTCSGRVDLASPPDRGVVLRRLDLELLRFRRHERRASFEDMLRARPEVLYRTCLEAGGWDSP